MARFPKWIDVRYILAGPIPNTVVTCMYMLQFYYHWQIKQNCNWLSTPVSVRNFHELFVDLLYMYMLYYLRAANFRFCIMYNTFDIIRTPRLYNSFIFWSTTVVET